MRHRNCDRPPGRAASALTTVAISSPPAKTLPLPQGYSATPAQPALQPLTQLPSSCSTRRPLRRPRSLPHLCVSTADPGPRHADQSQREATQRQTPPSADTRPGGPCRLTAGPPRAGKPPAQEVGPRLGLAGRRGHRRLPTPGAPGPECRTHRTDCRPSNAGQRAS